MTTLRLVALLSLGATAIASAQLAAPQPTEKLLVLPLAVSTNADSATSIAVMDAVRERLISLDKYRVLVVPKSKLCEALQASGFPCDVLLDDRGAGDLSRFLGVPNYSQGTLAHASPNYTAKVRLVSGASGFGSVFTATGTLTPGPTSLSEAITQRIHSIIRAAESARACQEQRGKGSSQKAADEARKALTIDPNLAAAHICLASVYEVQRAPADSQINEFLRALKGDSTNSEAYSRLAAIYFQKGDTLKALDYLAALARTDLKSPRTGIGVAVNLERAHQYQKAVALLDDVLAVNPGNPDAVQARQRICIEGSMWQCVLQGFDNQIRNGDTAVLIDTTSIKIAIGAAQSLSDTAHYQMWTLDAVKHYPRSAPFCKLRGGAFEQAGQRDSAIVVYQKCAALDPKDLSIGLLVAKAMVDRAVYDTAHSRQLTTAKDTANLRIMQEAFAARIDSARAYVQTVLASSDTTQRLSAAVILLTAGSKLAQAAAYERAFPWLDQLITEVAQRSPADTTGPRQAIRVNGSFWYGLSSTLALNHPYQDMIKSKSCTEAKAINDRLVRTRAALLLGGRVAPNVATQMLGYVGQYDANMPKVKKAFKCTGW